MDFPPTEHLSEWFRKMPRMTRINKLRSIISDLDISDCNTIMTMLKRKCNCDPLGQLSTELKHSVLRKISDPKTLLKMAGVCKSWRKSIMSDRRLWKHVVRRKGALTEAALSSVASLNSVNNCISALKWEAILAHNWITGESNNPLILQTCSTAVITCLQVDEKKNRLITGADNGDILVWNFRSGDLIHKLQGHQGGVWALTATKYTNGHFDYLVTGSTDRCLIVWNLDTGERLFDLVGHSSTVRCVEIIGEYIISGSRDCTLRVWSLTTGQLIHILTGHTGSVRCLAVFLNKYIVSGSYDCTLRVWDITRGVCMSVCEGNNGKVYSIATSGEFIFSGGMSSSIRKWNGLTGEKVNEYSDISGLVGHIEIRDKYLVAGNTEGQLCFYDLSNDESLLSIEKAHAGSITALSFNKHAIVTGADRSLKLWPVNEIFSDEPIVPLLLYDKPEVVWRIHLGETVAITAYLNRGLSCIEVLDFTPIL